MAWVVSAVVTAVEVMTAAAIFTAVAEVGVALTVVGTVTKSKELLSLGKVMSVVGGVGSLATSAFSAIGAAAAEGGVGVAEGAAAGAASDGAGEQFALQAGTDAAGSGFGAAAADGAAQTFPVDVGLGGLQNGGGMLQQPAANPAAAAAKPAVAGGMPAGQSAESMFNSTVSDAAAAPATFDVATTGAVAAPTDTSAFGIKRWFDGLDKATQGKVVSGAMQIGGSAVGGLFNGWSEEQKLALEQQRQALVQKNIDTQQSNANAQPRVQAYVKPTGMMQS